MITKFTLINVQYDTNLQKNIQVKGNSKLKKNRQVYFANLCSSI